MNVTPILSFVLNKQTFVEIFVTNKLRIEKKRKNGRWNMEIGLKETDGKVNEPKGSERMRTSAGGQFNCSIEYSIEFSSTVGHPVNLNRKVNRIFNRAIELIPRWRRTSELWVRAKFEVAGSRMHHQISLCHLPKAKSSRYTRTHNFTCTGCFRVRVIIHPPGILLLDGPILKSFEVAIVHSLRFCLVYLDGLHVGNYPSKICHDF